MLSAVLICFMMLGCVMFCYDVLCCFMSRVLNRHAILLHTLLLYVMLCTEGMQSRTQNPEDIDPIP